MPHPHHHQGLVFGYKRSCDELTTGGKQCFPPNQSVLLHVVLVYSFKLEYYNTNTWNFLCRTTQLHHCQPRGGWSDAIPITKWRWKRQLAEVTEVRRLARERHINALDERLVKMRGDAVDAAPLLFFFFCWFDRWGQRSGTTTATCVSRCLACQVTSSRRVLMDIPFLSLSLFMAILVTYNAGKRRTVLSFPMMNQRARRWRTKLPFTWLSLPTFNLLPSLFLDLLYFSSFLFPHMINSVR